MQNYAWDENSLMVSLGYLSLSAFGGLFVYLVWFLKKTKGYSLLSIPLVGLFLSKEALACAVCVGNPSSPLTQAVNQGVWALLYVIGIILVGFASLFIFWVYRASQLAKQNPTA